MQKNIKCDESFMYKVLGKTAKAKSKMIERQIPTGQREKNTILQREPKRYIKTKKQNRTKNLVEPKK